MFNNNPVTETSAFFITISRIFHYPIINGINRVSAFPRLACIIDTPVCISFIRLYNSYVCWDFNFPLKKLVVSAAATFDTAADENLLIKKIIEIIIAITLNIFFIHYLPLSSSEKLSLKNHPYFALDKSTSLNSNKRASDCRKHTNYREYARNNITI